MMHVLNTIKHNCFLT